MAFIGKLFGKGKEEPVASTNDQIQKLGDHLETIEKREAVLEKKIEQELAKAREASKKGKKNEALTHLKRKKTYEEQCQKLQAQRTNIEMMQMKLEEAAMNVEALKAQKEGAKALKNAYGKTDASKIDADMDEVRDTMDMANEISDAVAQPLGQDMLDEDDLEAELAELEQEELDKEILGMDLNKPGMSGMSGVNIPSGAIGNPKPAEPAKTEEEDALAALEAELNG
eukprot:NODE_5573_length_931_cov_96.815594_g5350_i0.p1 GENE.NODE_5573_length_931_cov_96.815594_g5350_i0~~NODE_5573_length_931_cov_96.815594_g5350_i0.p1  ORF type:complete len:227 (+),score=78.02 NODE_5573_length_931_cov_96.815594_g5350_i0:56-736(+)